MNNKIAILLLFIFLNISGSNPKKDPLLNVALQIEVSDEFHCRVYGIYPEYSKATHLPISQMARSLNAIDEAQRLLSSGSQDVPFSFRMTEYGDFNYDNHPLLHAYKKVFSAQKKLEIPPSIKRAIERGNKEFAEVVFDKPASSILPDIDLGFCVHVSEDYNYTVEVLYPKSAFVLKGQPQLAQIMGAFNARDLAQEALDKGRKHVPFHWASGYLEDYEYFDDNERPNYFTVLAIKGKMNIPAKIREKIEAENKQFNLKSAGK